jgi:uncharacterized membrane protein YbhN (UPF0104 family)
MTRKQLVRVLLTLVVTGGCLGYILWQLDVRQTVHILVHSNLAWFAGAVIVMLAGVPPMAYRGRSCSRPVGSVSAWAG